VTNKKLTKPISIFFCALSLPKCSDKISVHRNVEANNTVPNATGSGEKKKSTVFNTWMLPIITAKAE
jgi:hypothetical protein